MEKSQNTHKAETLERPKYVDSVKAAAAALGYPENVIQYLKDQGNPAWQGSRCYLDKLDDWIDENGIPEVPGSEKDVWDIRIAQERHRKLKIQNDIDDGKTVLKEDVVAFLYELAIRTKNQLKKALEDELPFQLAGKPVDEIRTINKGFVDKVCDRMQEDVLAWKN